MACGRYGHPNIFGERTWPARPVESFVCQRRHSTCATSRRRNATRRSTRPLFYEFQAEVESFDAENYACEQEGAEEFVATLPKR
jgi:hypothetical protein